MPPKHLEGIPDLIMAQWRDWYHQHANEKGCEAVRCNALVPIVPTPNPIPEVPSLPNWPGWMSGSAGGADPNDGEGIEEASERLDDLREQADIAEGI